MFCRSCGTENPDDSRFCEECGTAFARTDERATTPAPGVRPRGGFGVLPPGTLVDDYEVERELGEGGMGVVYQARHQRLGHAVALKVLAPHLARDAHLVDRFEQEARVQANLHHPSIVRVNDFISEHGLFAMVMEYVAGTTLAEEIHARTGPMPHERIKSIMLPVLEAVGMAHAHDIVHRDLKPSNIMLTTLAGRELPKVMDFGIAKVLQSGGMNTATAGKLGTLFYMAPEQCISSKNVDARSDIYSLGVTLYEMCCGRLPFDCDSEFELMLAHKEKEPPSPSDIYPGVPRDLESVVLQALEKEPWDRHQSADKMAAALKECEPPPKPAPEPDAEAPPEPEPGPAESEEIPEQAPAPVPIPEPVLEPEPMFEPEEPDQISDEEATKVVRRPGQSIVPFTLHPSPFSLAG